MMTGMVQCPLDGLQQLLTPGTAAGRQRHHVLPHRNVGGADQIRLVVAAQHRRFRLCQLGNQTVDHLDMLLPVGVGGINHMEQQIRIFQLLQSGIEGVDQVVRQLCNESNGIRQHHIQVIRHRQKPGGGIQRIKQPVVGRNPCTGELV